jgi:benzoylformate decarboxylase/acetolactate synthase-1/2/3 large subunit
MAPRRTPRYGSDLVVDFLMDRGVRYIPLNPGASYRGLHDSIVNTPGAPEIILCPHEKQAINMAHGLANATGEVAVSAVHDVVGLLHGTLGVFTAWHDRAPVMVLGGAGPMNSVNRRPWIEWVHTANVQGNAVRDFVKFDDQPSAIEAIPSSLVRAWRVAAQQPSGPVYVALDADVQEDPIEGPVPEYDWDRVKPSTPIGPDPAGLEQLTRELLAAKRPVIIASFAGRDPKAFEQIPALAELLGAGMIDTRHRLNFPNRHPLNIEGTDALDQADVLLLLDLKNVDKPLAREHMHERGMRSRVPAGARVLEIGFNALHTKSWVQDLGAIVEADVRLTADTSVALPMLLSAVQAAVEQEPEACRRERDERRAELTRKHDAQFAEWSATADASGDESPVSTAWLAREVWAAIQGSDWVLAGGRPNSWTPKLWDFDKHYRVPSLQIDTANQIATTIGTALAHKDKGRLVVNIQPDGDLMFDVGALWIAAAHKIPLLVVMYNNRAYYNDWGHQAKVAEVRGERSDPNKVHVGIGINPSPNFSRVAEGFGWYAEGPIDQPGNVRDAVTRAAEIVLKERRPALVDVICQPR